MTQNILPASLVLSTAIIFLGAFVDSQSDSELRAMTAHGTDKKTMATVPLDEGMEAVVTLDHTTGDLTGYVMDRFTGKFFIQYRYNLLQDFPMSQGKFLLAAGTADFRQVTGNERFANGVIYVAEEASGQVIAYALPWNSQARASLASPQRRSFVALDFAKTRFN